MGRRRSSTRADVTSDGPPVSVNASELEVDLDPVVSEVPIYLSSNVGPNLVVLQYPTRKVDRDESETSVTHTSEVRIKRKTGFVEADVPSNLPSQYFDVDKTERWGVLDHQTFGGVLKNAEGRYAVARMADGALHLSVVAHSAQLRPEFAHFDRQLTEEREIVKSLRETKTSGVVKAVQMTAKTMSEQAVKVSDAAELWKEAAAEQPKAYAITKPEDLSVLETSSRSPLKLQN